MLSSLDRHVINVQVVVRLCENAEGRVTARLIVKGNMIKGSGSPDIVR